MTKMPATTPPAIAPAGVFFDPPEEEEPVSVGEAEEEEEDEEKVGWLAEASVTSGSSFQFNTQIEYSNLGDVRAGSRTRCR